MEVITTITQTHYDVFVILAIISTGIIIAMAYKKFQDYKNHEDGRKNVLEGRIKKVEWAFKNILQRVDDIDIFLRNREIDKIELETMAIRGIINHQLGHMTYFRWLLK